MNPVWLQLPAVTLAVTLNRLHLLCVSDGAGQFAAIMVAKSLACLPSRIGSPDI